MCRLGREPAQFIPSAQLAYVLPKHVRNTHTHTCTNTHTNAHMQVHIHIHTQRMPITQVWLQQIKSNWREAPRIAESAKKLSKECQDLLDKVRQCMHVNTHCAHQEIQTHRTARTHTHSHTRTHTRTHARTHTHTHTHIFL